MSVHIVALLCALIVLGAACGSSSDASGRAPAAPSPTISAPAESPSPVPTPTPAESPSAPPATITVAFSGLRPGLYPTHLHSRCSGSQVYHLIVLQSLVIGSDGAGSIQVSSSYAGQGFCVIVYSSPSLDAVAATRQI